MRMESGAASRSEREHALEHQIIHDLERTGEARCPCRASCRGRAVRSHEPARSQRLQLVRPARCGFSREAAYTRRSEISPERKRARRGPSASTSAPVLSTPATVPLTLAPSGSRSFTGLPW